MVHNATYIRDVVNKRPFGWTYREDVNLTYSFSFEEIDPFWWHHFISSNWALGYYAGAAYIFVIFGLQRWMRDRPAFKLRKSLFLWNLSLGVFSTVGFVRFFPGFLVVLGKPSGFYTSICLKKDTTIPMGFWTLMFILSKFWELGDTVFIVLRKRPLIFLQWYHHLVTMLVTWIIAPHMEGITRWYVCMNYLVHMLMYPYFALKAIQVHVPVVVANIITTLQLVQMFFGFGVNLLSVLYPRMGYDCFRHPDSIRAFSLVYGSFLILFGKLFYDSVLRSGRLKKERMAKKVE